MQLGQIILKLLLGLEFQNSKCCSSLDAGLLYRHVYLMLNNVLFVDVFYLLYLLMNN